MTAAGPGLSAFLSYSRSDEAVVRELRACLASAGLDTFFDREALPPGVSWPDTLETALGSTSGVIVVLGPGGLGDWQKREVFFALDRQVGEQRHGRRFPVIPVLLPNASVVPSFLFQNTWVEVTTLDRLGETASILVDALRGAATPLRDRSEVCPFRGLRPFREEHSAFFYGREDMIAALGSRVERQSVIAVVGASGSGKSSVVLGGLVPELRRRRPPRLTWNVAVSTPGAHPWRQLADALAALTGTTDGDLPYVGTTLAEDLKRNPAALPAAVLRVLRSPYGADRLLLVVDQLEEIFTLAPAEARPFIESLLDATRGSPLHVVLTLRADFYSHALQASRPLSDALMQGQINVGPMSREEIRRSIMRPATKVGLRYEPGLVEALLDSVENQPGTLPLLQYALTTLWNERSDGALTHAAFRRTGGVNQSIATRCDAIVAALSDEERIAARHLFGHLVHVGGADEAVPLTRQRVRRDRLSSASWAVAQKFAAPEHRLLVVAFDADSGQEAVEVAHEALILHWTVLGTWVQEDRRFLLWQQELDLYHRAWEASGRDPSALLRGGALAAAKGWLGSHGQALSAAIRTFILKSARRTVRERVAWIAAAVVLVGGTLAVTLWWKPRWQEARALAQLKHYGAEITEVADGRRAVFFSGDRFKPEALRGLANLANLRELDVAETTISDEGLRQLPLLPRLRELNLNATNIGDAGLAEVTKQASLEVLRLVECRRLTSAGFASLRNLSNLRMLVVDETAFGNDDLPLLASLPKLRQLSLDHTAITDDGLAKLRHAASLETLWLENDEISDAGLPHLAALKHLRMLDVGGTKIRGFGLHHLAGLPELRNLSLRSAIVDDSVAPSLVRLKALRELDLAHTKIGDDTLRAIPHLPRLQGLYIIGVQSITVSGISALATSPELREIFMGGTRIGDEGVLHLARMKSLRKLWLIGNPITAEGLRDAITQGTVLEEINVNDTSISTQAAAALSNARLRVIRQAP